MTAPGRTVTAVTVHREELPPTPPKERPRTATPTHITGIRTVSIPVDDQDAALPFYTETLGFTVLRDNPTPNGGRWIELVAGSDNAIVTLEPAFKGDEFTTPIPANVKFDDSTDMVVGELEQMIQMKIAQKKAEAAKAAPEIGQSIPLPKSARPAENTATPTPPPLAQPK